MTEKIICDKKILEEAFELYIDFNKFLVKKYATSIRKFEK
jgi:hypothetical protein